MKKTLLTMSAVLMIAASGWSQGIVNNSGTTAADSTNFPFFAMDSVGNVIALASGDSVFLLVSYPGGGICIRDSLAYNGGNITAATLSSYTLYNWGDAFADLDGTPVEGVYTYVIVCKDATGADLGSPFMGTRQLYEGRDFGTALDFLVDSLQAALDSVQLFGGWVPLLDNDSLIVDRSTLWAAATRTITGDTYTPDVNVTTIANDAITAASIAVAAIDNSAIASNAIDANKLNPSTIGADELAADAVTEIITAWLAIVNTDTVNGSMAGYLVANVGGGAASTDTAMIKAMLVNNWTSAASGLGWANMLRDTTWLRSVRTITGAIGLTASSYNQNFYEEIFRNIDTLNIDTSDIGDWLVNNLSAGGGLDSGAVSRIVGRKAWGIAAGVGSDSSTIAQRVLSLDAMEGTYATAQFEASFLTSALTSGDLWVEAWGSATRTLTTADWSTHSQTDVWAVVTREITGDTYTPDVNVVSIAAGVITATSIATDAITSAKLAADCIGNSELASGAITNLTLAANCIGNSEIAADAITASELAGSCITSSELGPTAVTEIINDWLAILISDTPNGSMAGYLVKNVGTGGGSIDWGVAGPLIAGHVDDTLGAVHGATSWASTAGDGGDTLVYYARDTVNNNYVSGVNIVCLKATGELAGVGITNASGFTYLTLIDGNTYNIMAMDPSYYDWETLDTVTFTTAAPVDSVKGAKHPIDTATAANTCNVYGTVRGIDGTALPYATVTFTLPNEYRSTCDTSIIAATSVSTKTNGAGLFEQVLIYSSCLGDQTYTITIEHPDYKARTTKITVPDAASYEVLWGN